MNRSDPFFRAYVEAALWSSTDESTDSGGYPLDDNYTIDDIDLATLMKMSEDCARFLAQYGSYVEGREDLAGYHFWLTRNGHGSGFWNGDWGEDGDYLTDCASSFREYNLSVEDDGRIHGYPG